jgi:penicillin-binding protein 1A
MLIRRVEDRDGRVLYAAAESAHRAITSTTAFLMSTMMADVINAGTGAKARSLGFTLPAAGKTGTTNDFNDAWFVGYTPHLVAGVWVGFDQPHTILPNGFAGDVAVPMWASFMKAATKGDKPDWFAPPSGIVTANVCRLSGKLAAAGCENVEVTEKDGHLVKRSMVYTEYFVRGTEPTTTCLLHSTHSFFGTIASVFKGDEKPAPVRIEDTGIPPQTATSGVTPEATPAPAAAEQPKKKRGFWSRVFGGGKNNDKPATPEQGASDDKHQDR